MIEDRPSLQLPVPDERDMQLYEEWLRREQEQEDEQKDDSRVIVIEI